MARSHYVMALILAAMFSHCCLSLIFRFPPVQTKVRSV